MLSGTLHRGGDRHRYLVALGDRCFYHRLNLSSAGAGQGATLQRVYVAGYIQPKSITAPTTKQASARSTVTSESKLPA